MLPYCHYKNKVIRYRYFTHITIQYKSSIKRFSKYITIMTALFNIRLLVQYRNLSNKFPSLIS